MKKLMVILTVVIFLTCGNAQTWKPQISRISGKSAVKTLKIKPRSSIKVRSFLLDSDSLKVDKKYEGSFAGFSGNSVQIRVTKVSELKRFPGGITQHTTIPGKSYLMPMLSDTGLASITLPEIDHLAYSHKNWNTVDGLIQPLLYASVIAIILSPVISYNFADGEFDSGKYQYWGAGSAAGLTLSLIGILISSDERAFQFRTGWPEKNAKVWSFK